MRKLTAGIFSVLLGLVSVGGANAAVVSTEYLSEVLQTELADMQTTMTANGPVKIENNVVSVETGDVSEQGTNLVTAAGIYAALNAAVADQQLKSDIVGKADALTDENLASDVKYPSMAAAKQIAEDAVSDLTQSNTALQGAVGAADTAKFKEKMSTTGNLTQAGNAADAAVMLDAVVGAVSAEDMGTTANTVVGAIKEVGDELQDLANGAVATNTANIATLTGDATTAGSVAKAVADAKSELQGKIDLKANIADVYSRTEAEAKFEAQAAATAKLQAAKDYTDEQLKTLTEDMWGGGEGSEDQGLQGVVASQALKITALEDKVGDKSVVARIAELDSSDTAVDKEFVTAVSENDGVITVSRRALAAADIPVIAVSQVDGLQAALDAKQVNLTGQDGVIVIAGGVVSIASQGIGTAQLKDESVTAEKMAMDSVTSNAIAAGAVTAGKIATGAVIKGTIADGAVEAGNLAENAVQKGNIAAGAVDTNSIADNAVGTNQLADSVNSLLTGAIQAPSETNADGTFVLTAKKNTGADGKVTYSYAWEDIAGRSE